MTGSGYLTMAAVRQITALTERQIRYYDEKGLVVPDRTPGGHRVYTQAHVDLLLAVKGLLAKGLSVEEVRQQLRTTRGGSSDPEHRVCESFDERGLEDVKIYFESLRRSRE